MNYYHLIIIIVIIVIIMIIFNNKNVSGEHYTTETIDIKEFAKIIKSSKDIIIAIIMDYGMTCIDMNGKYESSLNRQLSLACNTDQIEIEDKIIASLLNFIDDYVRSNYKRKINKYSAVRVMKKHMDLLEQIIYPLSNSQIYTLNGVQYFTKNLLRKTVYTNKNITDVIYSVFMENGINVVK